MKDLQNLEGYSWKTDKNTEVKMLDCTEEELRKYYNHCNEMLYNTDYRTPGRYVLIKILQEQIDKCRAVLLIRWLRTVKEYSQQHCYEDIRTLISNNQEISSQLDQISISSLISELPIEYSRVPVSYVLNACLSNLGVMNTSHITLTFIASLGIFLTDQDKKGLEGEGTYLDMIREREGINPSIKLFISSKGLSYPEFQQLRRLKSKQYDEYTTVLLKVLSNKVLYKLQSKCQKQGQQWEALKSQIEEIAEYKGYRLCQEDQETQDKKNVSEGGGL